MGELFAARTFARRIVSAALLAAASTARAGDVVELEWNAPAECPTRGDVVAAIRAMLGSSSALAEAKQPFRARASVARSAEQGWTLHLTAPGQPSGRERIVEGEDCAELADAAAVIIALAIDPKLDAHGLASTGPRDAKQDTVRDRRSASAAPADGAPALRGADSANDSSPPGSAAGLRGAVGLFGALDVAALPSPAPGIGLRGGVGIDRWGVSAYGVYFPSQRATIAGSEAGGDVSLLLGGLEGRYRLIDRSLELEACAAMEAGSYAAESFGVPTPGAGHALWLAPGIGVRTAYTVSKAIAVNLGLHGFVPLSRERFVVTGLDEVHQVPPVTVRATLGVEARIW